MSMSTLRGESRGERITANSKIVWGNDDYDLEIDFDDSNYYS